MIIIQLLFHELDMGLVGSESIFHDVAFHPDLASVLIVDSENPVRNVKLRQIHFPFEIIRTRDCSDREVSGIFSGKFQNSFLHLQ